MTCPSPLIKARSCGTTAHVSISSSLVAVAVAAVLLMLEGSGRSTSGGGGGGSRSSSFMMTTMANACLLPSLSALDKRLVQLGLDPPPPYAWTVTGYVAGITQTNVTPSTPTTTTTTTPTTTKTTAKSSHKCAFGEASVWPVIESQTSQRTTLRIQGGLPEPFLPPPSFFDEHNGGGDDDDFTGLSKRAAQEGKLCGGDRATQTLFRHLKPSAGPSASPHSFVCSQRTRSGMATLRCELEGLQYSSVGGGSRRSRRSRNGKEDEEDEDEDEEGQPAVIEASITDAATVMVAELGDSGSGRSTDDPGTASSTNSDSQKQLEVAIGVGSFELQGEGDVNEDDDDDDNDGNDSESSKGHFNGVMRLHCPPTPRSVGDKKSHNDDHAASSTSRGTQRADVLGRTALKNFILELEYSVSEENVDSGDDDSNSQNNGDAARKSVTTTTTTTTTTSRVQFHFERQLLSVSDAYEQALRATELSTSTASSSSNAGSRGSSVLRKAEQQDQQYQQQRAQSQQQRLQQQQRRSASTLHLGSTLWSRWGLPLCIPLVLLGLAKAVSVALAAMAKNNNSNRKSAPVAATTKKNKLD